MVSLYLKHRQIPIPIINFRGNRFNVLFHNAAGTYFLAPYIVEYIQTSKTTINQSQNFLLGALQNTQLLKICRALGVILKKVVTEPYWRLAGDSAMTALDMAPVYNRLLDLLSSACTDPAAFLENCLHLLPGPAPQRAAQHERLFGVSDTCVADIAVKFCTAVKTKAEYLFSDFYPGGKFHNVQSADNTLVCPANNITVERLMAKLDSGIKRAPNINTHNLQHTIMYNNNTAQWLKDKDITQMESIIQQTRHDKNTYMSQTAAEKTELQQQHMAVIKERQEVVMKRKEKEQEKKAAVIADMEDIGLWESEQEINTELDKMKTKKDKMQALKKQFGICKEIHSIQTQHKALLAFSSKGKTFTLNTLVHNLSQLINIYHTPTDTSQYIGRQIIHTWSESGEDHQWNGKILSYDKGIFKVAHWRLTLQSLHHLISTW